MKRSGAHLDKVGERPPLLNHVRKHCLSVLALVVVRPVAVKRFHLSELAVSARGEGYK